MNLRDRITVFKINLTEGDAGEQIEEREDIKIVWCKVIPMNEQRALEHGLIVGNRAFMVYLRVQSLPELNNDMFFEWKGQTLVIHSVKDSDARGKYFEVIANGNETGY